MMLFFIYEQAPELSPNEKVHVSVMIKLTLVLSYMCA